MKILSKILIVLMLIAIIILVIGNSITLAATTMDYNFTDETDLDREEEGFIWTASTRTLTITNIIDSSAKIKLPENSTIDIQGNKENVVEYIVCSGNLTIKGNDIASLSIKGKYKYSSTLIGTSTAYSYAMIYLGSSNSLTIDGGNINIDVYKTIANDTYYGIYSKEVTINKGNINIKLPGRQLTGVYAISGTTYINGGNTNVSAYGDAMSNRVIMNDGYLIVSSAEEYGMYRKMEINGGSVLISGKGGAFKEIPSINTNCKILYNKTSTDIEKAMVTDETEIGNIYKSKIIKITKIKLGDVNEDGEITLADYAKILAHVKGTSLLTGTALKAADVNGDGKVTLADYAKVLAHVKGTALLE